MQGKSRFECDIAALGMTRFLFLKAMTSPLVRWTPTRNMRLATVPTPLPSCFVPALENEPGGSVTWALCSLALLQGKMPVL